MKFKTLFFLIASLGLAAVSQTTRAADCGPVKDFDIKKPVNFSRTSVNDAMRKIMSGTPYVAEGSSSNKKKIGAEQIAGNLEAVLDELTSHVGVKWSQDGCTIRFSDKVASKASDKSKELPGLAIETPKEQIQASFEVKKGESLRVVLDRWTAQENWNVSWGIDEFEVIELGEAASFEGPMKHAIAKLVDAMANAGEKLDVTYHNGNKVVRVARYAN